MMATILIFVLNPLIAECETMFRRDRETGRIAKGMRE